MLITLIQEAMKNGCRVNPACVETEISLRTYRRWLCGKENTVDKRPGAKRPEPSNKLSQEERQTILDTCNDVTSNAKMIHFSN